MICWACDTDVTKTDSVYGLCPQCSGTQPPQPIRFDPEWIDKGTSPSWFSRLFNRKEAE